MAGLAGTADAGHRLSECIAIVRFAGARRVYRIAQAL